MKFYKCMHCGNVAVKVHDAGVPLVCCGEKMKELIAGESDGAAEKHVPAYSENGGRVLVEVGSVAHPMTEEHSINFIALETKKGYQIAYLRAGEKPEAEFSVISRLVRDPTEIFMIRMPYSFLCSRIHLSPIKTSAAYPFPL